MADNVLGTLFQSIADAIRNKTGDTGKIVPADFPNEINSIVVGTGGGGGTETGLGDLKIANGSFNAGTGYRKTITHGLGKMPDLVVVWYAESGDADEGAQHAAKMVLSFSMGLHSSMAEVTSYKGYYHHFGFMGLNYSKYIDDPSSATAGNIYCPDDNTFTIGKVDDGSNTTGSGLLAASGIYNWLAISGMGGVIGGSGSAEGCVTVTFMDGDAVLFTRPVYVGDDCPDPVTQGRITTPAKESTAQYEYPYNGWSLTKGGNADSNALTNVTEDRVVYAAFEETARTYTITYYDDNGTSVLKTEQLAYGTVPNYTPTKTNVTFGYWSPTPVAVTGDASYTAVWSSVLYSGTMPSNSNIKWSITNLGVLTLSGTGVLSADSQRKTPYQTYRSSVTKVVVEQGITEIGNYGLRNMGSMVELILPSSVTKIGESYACYMPTSLKTIEWGGVTYIGNDAFNDCPALIITLPEGLTYIGARAFYNAKATTSLRIPSSVTVIGSGAFSSSGLTELTFDDPNGWYVTVDGSDIDLNLSDPATNATYIKTTYNTTWKKRTT